MEEWHRGAEKILAKLAKAHAISGMLKHGIGVDACIDGINTWFPMNDQQASLVSEKFHGQVPAASITFDHEPISEVEAKWISDYIATYMQPASPFHLKFSHLLIDTKGMFTTCSKSTQENAFATLVVPLQSVIDGGEMKIKANGSTLSYSPVDNSFVAFETSSVVEMEAIANGRLCMLVYDIIYDSPPDAKAGLKTQQLLPEINQCFDDKDWTTMAYRFWDQYDNLSIEELQAPDRNVLNALVASGCFDVAVVRAVPFSKDFAPHVLDLDYDLYESENEEEYENIEEQDEAEHEPENLSENASQNGDEVFGAEDDAFDEEHDDAFDDDDFDGDEDEVASNDRITIVSQALFVPECNVPLNVKKALIGKPLHKIIANASPRISSDALKKSFTCLVFWQKKHRLRLLGFREAMMLLHAQLEKREKNDYTGDMSLVEMTQLTLSFFDEEYSLCNIFDVANPVEMATFLTSLDNFALITQFISKHLVISDISIVNEISEWLIALVKKYGWEKMHASFINLFSRQNSVASLANSYSCLSSFIKNDTVIIRQRHFIEGLKQWYDLLLTRTVNSSDLTRCEYAEVYGHYMLTKPLVIESCIRHDTPTLSVGSYFATRLPTSIIFNIDSYIRQTTLDHLFKWIKESEKVCAEFVFNVGIDVNQYQISMPLQPYKDFLLENYEFYALQLNAEDFSALLVLCQNSNHFTQVLYLPVRIDTFIDGVTHFIKTFKATLSMDDKRIVYNRVIDIAARCLSSWTNTSGNKLLFPSQITRLAIFVAVTFEHQQVLNDIVDLYDHLLVTNEVLIKNMCPSLPLLLMELDEEYGSELLAWKFKLAAIIRGVLEHDDNYIENPPKTPNLVLNTKLLHCGCGKCQAMKDFMQHPTFSQLVCKRNLLCIHFVQLVNFEQILHLQVKYLDNGDMELTKMASRASRDYNQQNTILYGMQQIISRQTKTKTQRRKKPRSRRR